ncbi:MAG: S8 family serine peptidase [Planctomycetota bacterium]|jgi:hypothetical protein
MSLRVKALALTIASLCVVQSVAQEPSGKSDAIPGDLKATSAQKDERIILLPDSNSRIRIRESSGEAFYSRNSGESWDKLQQISHELRFHYQTFDPIEDGEPAVPTMLRASSRSRLRIVQFETQILSELKDGITAAGAEVMRYLPDQAYLVRMDSAAEAAVEALPYVRWVGDYHPAYRLEHQILDLLQGGAAVAEAVVAEPYNVMMVDPKNDRAGLVTRLNESGIPVRNPNGRGILMVAEMTPNQLRLMYGDDAVLWIDRLTEISTDIDIARIQGGANYVESVAGLDGKGITGMVMEGAWPGHEEFAARPPYRDKPFFIGDGSYDGHGQNTAGEIYAMGVRPDAKGIIPFAQMGYCNSSFVFGNDLRVDVTTEAVLNHQATIETASWGYARTTLYTSRSAEMDNIVFNLDLLVTNSQSNAGGTAEPRGSRPQAWAKNVLAVGAFRHYGTADPSDDVWLEPGLSGGSIGPAEDGRIKPDLSAFYDGILTTSAPGYNPGFGGTSGATPIVNGYAGLTTQMFSLGMFGNPGATAGTDSLAQVVTPWKALYAFRPHFTTVKALMINSARQHNFSGANHDLTRVHQGWGMPSVEDLYDNRNGMLVVDESFVLKELEARMFQVFVPPGTPEFRATMVYADPEAVPGSTVDRINSLDLIAVSPGGVQYFGNNGLKENMFSTPFGVANDLDTVENIWVQNPTAGSWTITVRAAAIRQDGHVETEEDMDVDFALAVSGLAGHSNMERSTLDLKVWPELGVPPGNFSVRLDNLPSNWVEGYTFFSNRAIYPKGLGNYHGLEIDALFNIILAQPLAEGNVFHFTNGDTDAYPHVEFEFPSSMSMALRGVTFDAIAVFLDGSGNIVDITNVDRGLIR